MLDEAIMIFTGYRLHHSPARGPLMRIAVGAHHICEQY